MVYGNGARVILMGMYCSGNRKGVDFQFLGTQSIYILHYYGYADTLCHADGLTAIEGDIYLGR